MNNNVFGGVLGFYFVMITIAGYFLMEGDKSYPSYQKEIESCTVEFKGTIRRGQVVKVYEVRVDHLGLTAYRIDNHANPTWMYPEVFHPMECE